MNTTIHALRSKVIRLSKSHAFQQTAWVVGGMVASQGIRLGGNLILTRLLFPDAFGLIALAMAIITGIAMLSDVGLRSAVIKSSRSTERAFMETVWTLQAVRGILLSIVICVIAVPAAKFYDESMLLIILPVLSIDILFRNLKSVSLYLYDKKLELKKQVLIDTGAQLLGLIVMITWAVLYPSIWALVAGALLNSLIQLINSYVLFEGNYSRFRWERQTVKEVLSFGIWIFLSTALGFLSNQGDRLIMGIWMDMSELGVYTIAAILASVVNMIITTLSFRILQPLYRQHIENNDIKKIYKIRDRLNLICITGCVVLSIIGNFVVELLWDPRYAAAGWMTQLLAIRGIGFCLYSTLQAYLLSSGNSFSLMKYQAAHTTYLVLGIIVGAQFGTIGIMVAFSISTIVCYPIMAFNARQLGFSKFNMDTYLTVAGLVLAVSGWHIFNSPLKELLFYWL